MKKSSLIISLLLVVACSHAQSIAGTWKCLSNVLVNDDGTRQDLWKSITEAFASATDMQYIFEADGKHYIKADKKCAIIAKMGSAIWSQSGKTITLTSTTDKTGTATTYTAAFTGNTLTLTHVYTIAEKQKLSIKTQKITLTYQKL
jgi:hypothetical protein